ncbi:MAG TPA: 3-hydroxyacyl-CoA dehydrogenase/enoyl-CoA hydratase family protein [Gallionella sp.]|nr:3-hydroxyacyl-CoA dehydrogenase/enoyl-CoA hydratase family protein [Gallionella sp.]
MSRNFQIRKVAVLGAGVMGAQIAAHLVNGNVPAILFDLAASEGEPNSIVSKALDGLKKLEPDPLASPARVSFISAANYGQHLEKLRDCDLVIEAIAERMEWKSELYRKVAPYLGAHTIFASNTSGLSLNELARAFPENLRHRFCGIHFFNPPRYMHLVELIPCAQTDANLLDQLETFLVSDLGKGVVRAKDTPNFVANRIGVFSMLATLHHAQHFGIPFDTVDALTGRYLGRPKSATFRTLDVVGLDIFANVVGTMRDHLADDPWHSYFAVPAWLEELIAQGALGQKAGRGVYQKVGKEIHVLDLHSKQYRLSHGEVDEGVKAILRERDWGKKLYDLRVSAHPQAQFIWNTFRDVFHYCAVQLEHIAHTARDLDFAVRWGFGWDQGPFEIWQAAGWHKVAGWIEHERAHGKTMSSAALPAWATDPDRTGVHTHLGSFAPSLLTPLPLAGEGGAQRRERAGQYIQRSQLPVYQRQEFPDRLLGEETPHTETIFENDNARLWHSGDDIAILSFKSKLHVIGDEVLDSIQRAIAETEANWRGLIIWQTEPPFSAGANLLQLLQGLQPESADAGVFDKLKHAADRIKYTIAGGGGIGAALNAAAGNVPEVEAVVAKFQQTTRRIKYAQVPVIAAVDGLALGGGCEIIMHAARVVASLESYIGLVEAGVGLLPAGGGCKEAALRAATDARSSANNGSTDLLPFVRRYFQNIALGEVGKSAELAREMGYLRQGDRIVMNRFEVLHVAKQELRALTATSYRPPLPPAQIPVAGRTGKASLQMVMVNMLEGGFISEHDYRIGCAIADTLCGGDVEPGSLVDEQWLLDLERKHFMALLATEKTQARIEYMLKNGKALRN